MDMLAHLKDIYAQYSHDVKELRQNASVFDGMFGMGNDPRDDRLHDVFYDYVGKWAELFLQQNPSGEDVAAAVRWILEAAALHRNEDVYWYYFAAQIHVKAMIPLLAADDCKAIRDWYQEHYPRIERMPVQRDVYRMLCRSAKQNTR